MKVLYIVPYPPDLIRVRPYNLIRHLAKMGHDVIVATLWSNDQERLAIERLTEEGFQVQSAFISPLRSIGNCLASTVTTVPLQAEYSWHPGFAKLLQDLVFSEFVFPKFDVIHVEHLRGVKYGLYLQTQARKKVLHRRYPIFIWDSVDCISHLFRQAIQHGNHKVNQLPARIDLGRTERFEGQLTDRFDSVLVTSSIDKDALLSLHQGDQTPMNVIPNGVDLTYFSPDDQTQREPATIVVSGKMSYHANIEMVLHLATDIMPMVWASRPDAKLCVVGKDPPREIRKLAKNACIEVTGSVKDIRPYLCRATIAVSPLVYGAGIQNKVLEAMACGTAVISSPQAVSALSTSPGVDIILAESPALFARAILDLLVDPKKRLRVGQAGRSYVENHHNWSTIVSQLENTYNEAVEFKKNQYHQGGNFLGGIENEESPEITMMDTTVKR